MVNGSSITEPNLRDGCRWNFESWLSSISRSPLASFFFAFYVGGYVALLIWFKQVDVYHSYFSTGGVLVLTNNLFRVLFILYLFWMVQTVGALVLQLVAGAAVETLGTLDRLALEFFTGTGGWHIAMLALGFSNLYLGPVAVAITLPLIVLSFQNVDATARRACQAVATYGSELQQSHGRVIASIGVLLLTVPLVGVAGLLLLVKGLYPAGGHDYFTHYFYYYQSVIDHHGLWPNEVWYHFYYSKGAGLYFLGILLTDALAPQLVTYCFIIASAFALFQLLRRVAPRTLWPWAGAIIYLGLYIYTPGPEANRIQGGWGDFEKSHELNAALIISILWIVAGAAERRGRVALAWWSAAGSAICTAVVINTSIAAYIGAVFTLLAAWHFLAGRRRLSLAYIALAAVTAVTLIVMLAINYFATGLINDQGILWFWPFANVEKLRAWGALPLVITLHWATDRMVADNRFLAGEPYSIQSIKFLLSLLRTDILYPLFAGGFVATVAALVGRRWHIAAKHQAIVLLASLVAFGFLALSAGQEQPISFYRYSSFVIPITIAAGILLCNFPIVLTPAPSLGVVRDRLFPLVILSGCVAAAFASYPRGAFSTIMTNAWRFATGKYSIDIAYMTQNGWPGRVPWGAIYPGARGAYAVVGPQTPIWSMHVHNYCMLPDCRMMSYSSFIMTPDWDRLMYGTPESGRAVLQAAGLNYFLFSRELTEHVKLVDILPLSPLFSPDNIGRYLGIRWTDGKTALLTWLGPQTQPFDQSWLADYRRAVENSPTAKSFPIDAMREIYEQLRATPHPWRAFDLPCKRNRPNAMC